MNEGMNIMGMRGNKVTKIVMCASTPNFLSTCDCDYITSHKIS